MPRKDYGTLGTIEYIGPRPKKAKKQFFGGWVILLIAAGIGLFFGRPLVASLINEQVKANADSAEIVIRELKNSESSTTKLAIAALQCATQSNESKSSSELLIECYEKAYGIDLRKMLEDDMASAFDQYPQLWNEVKVNPDLDFTRLPNYQRFFQRSTEDVQADALEVGDVVFWATAGGSVNDSGAHCAIVVPSPIAHQNDKWIVHFTSDGVKWENKYRDFAPVRGRYRNGQ